MKKYRYFILIISFYFSFNQFVIAQVNDLKTTNIEIFKLKKNMSKYLYNPKNIRERLLYFENEFRDSITVIINDSIIKKDFFTTNFSKGTTGKILCFNYNENKDLKGVLELGDAQKGFIKYLLIIKKKILRNYKLFFFYKIKDKIILYYSNYLPYYE